MYSFVVKCLCAVEVYIAGQCFMGPVAQGHTQELSSPTVPFSSTLSLPLSSPFPPLATLFFPPLPFP